MQSGPEAPAPSSARAQASTVPFDPFAAESSEEPHEQRAESPLVEAAKPSASRHVGDFVVHRFSGSFRAAPLTLTQKVRAREGNLLVIDMTFDEGSSKQTLRVRMEDSAEKRGEVVSVAILDGATEKPASTEIYEALMAKTTLAADQNEELLGSEKVTVEIAGSPIECQQTSYRVKIGKRRATLQTLQSDKFTWGDLSGAITAENGDVVYRAELVEAGNGDPKPAPAAPAVAHTDVYDDL